MLLRKNFSCNLKYNEKLACLKIEYRSVGFKLVRKPINSNTRTMSKLYHDSCCYITTVKILAQDFSIGNKSMEIEKCIERP